MMKESPKNKYGGRSGKLVVNNKTVWMSFEMMVGATKNGGKEFLVMNDTEWYIRYSLKELIEPNRDINKSKFIKLPSGRIKLFKSFEKAQEYAFKYFFKMLMTKVSPPVRANLKR